MYFKVCTMYMCMCFDDYASEMKVSVNIRDSNTMNGMCLKMSKKEGFYK